MIFIVFSKHTTVFLKKYERVPIRDFSKNATSNLADFIHMQLILAAC